MIGFLTIEQQEMMLAEEIAVFRQGLEEKVERFGLSSPEVLLASQQMDLLILKAQRLKSSRKQSICRYSVHS